MAEQDVLRYVIHVCEQNMKQVDRVHNITELQVLYNHALISIMAICGGALAMKIEGD